MNAQSRVDRRRARRLTDPSEHDIQSVRIKFGEAAAIVDASPIGVLIDTSHRLRPGARVELQMETSRHRISVRGRVVRCAVARVRAAGILYRGAVVFDQHLPWFVADSGYPIPASEQSDSRDSRAGATHVVL